MKGKLSFMWRATLALVLVLSLGVVMAVPVSAAGDLANVTAIPGNDMAGATTTYEIEFDPATTYVIDSVEMEFATGFGVSGATLGTVEVIGAGTVSSSGQVVTYSLTESELLDSGDDDVTINLSGIVNPAADTYSPGVTVRTMSGTTTIDEGSDAVTIVAAPVSFKVETQNALSETAGTPFTVTITAMSAAAGGGSPVTGYEGLHLIDFSSTASDPKIIPAFEVIDFGTGDGIGTLTGVVFNVVETGKTITATDSEISVTGTSEAITVIAGAADYLAITGAPTPVTAGVAFSTDVIVTAYDAGGNVRIAETEVVSWTSSDTTATTGSGLPADHALEAGTYTFLKAGFILETVGAVAGAQTITATGGSSGLSVTATVTVNPAAASTLTVAAVPTSIAADGVASSIITATAKDAFANVDTNYTASVTFSASLGTLSEVDANFVAGVAEATLTSTTTGTATILVASGTLTDVTTTVTLTAAGIEVWVDDTGNDNNPGTETLPFATIATGITAAGAGGTVNVGTGTYAPGSTLTIAAAGLTLQSTGTTVLTPAIITAPVSPDGAIRITADDVIVDGFTIIDSSGAETAYGILCVGADDAIIRNNEVTFAVSDKGGIDTGIGTGVEVSGNTLNAYAVMIVHGSDSVISGNTFGNCINFWALSSTLEGVTITDNTFLANANSNMAILIRGDGGSEAIDDCLIEGNTLTGRANSGIWIGADAVLAVTNLTITGNDITNNTVDGITIEAGVTWGAGNTISNNNIVGNVTLSINNEITTVVIDAENNWWGDATGPFHTTTNPDAKGFPVSSYVDYTPWLTAPYAMPADPVTSATISLVTGWNLISLPIIPTSSVIATVLAGLITAETVDQVRIYEQGDWSNWASTEPHGTLTIMKDGSGYWIDMNAADSLVVAGSELPAPPATPPSYSVYTGWNMIGFKSVDTNTTVAAYLGTMVAGTLEAIYGYDAAASAYFIPGVTTGHLKLEPGCGYWLAVNAAGTIYP